MIRLHEFLAANRDELIARCRSKVELRSRQAAPRTELGHGIAVFLDQLIKTLAVEQTSEPQRGRKVSGPSGGGKPVMSEIGESAALHGKDMSAQGFTVEEVVHDYGDLCQAITDLAVEREVKLDADEFRTMNRCLDNAMAKAVAEFDYQRHVLATATQTEGNNVRLGFFAHELRNLLSTAMLARSILKHGDAGDGGAAGGVLDRSLVGLANLIDRSLAEVRLSAGEPVLQTTFSLSGFIAEVKRSGTLEAEAKNCTLTVSEVNETLAVDADRDLLFSAVGNLLQNAFKFSAPRSEITLNAYSQADRIFIDVEDHCGGLPQGKAENLFLPFTQSSTDRSGLGLGLSISRRSVEANGGILSVRNVPGIGCVFTIDLPRHLLEIDRAFVPPS